MISQAVLIFFKYAENHVTELIPFFIVSVVLKKSCLLLCSPNFKKRIKIFSITFNSISF